MDQHTGGQAIGGIRAWITTVAMSGNTKEPRHNGTTIRKSDLFFVFVVPLCRCG
jgi:hypothetical protein